jgi:hypothetical protein
MAGRPRWHHVMSNRAQRRAEEAASRRRARVKVGHVSEIGQKVLELGRKEAEYAESQKDLGRLVEELVASELDMEDKLDHAVDLFAEAVQAAQSKQEEPVAALRALVEDHFAGGSAAEITEEGSRQLTSEMEAYFGRFRESFVACQWAGCTAENVDIVVADEVVARAMLRADVALGISCCDRIAVECSRAMKEGLDVVEIAHDVYRRTLGADRAREIRARLLEAGWNGATEQTLEDTVCANVLREGELRARTAIEFGILSESYKTPEAEAGFVRRWEPIYRDTVLRHKINLAVRSAVSWAMAADARLELSILQVARLVKDEFLGFDQSRWAKFRKQLVWAGYKGCTEQTVDDVLVIELLMENRWRVVARYGADEWLRRASESLKEAERLGTTDLMSVVGWLSRTTGQESGEEPSGDHARVQAALDKMGVSGRVLDVPKERVTLTAQTVDHALMRIGRDLWQATYAKGMSDEKARGVIEADPRLQAETGRFAAKWAVHAFQRMTTSHTYAAYCMSMDPSPEVLSPVEEAWRAWSVMVPNGMLAWATEDGTCFEFRRILVAVYDSRAWMGFYDYSGPGGSERFTVTDDAPTLAELLSRNEDGHVSADLGAVRYRFDANGGQCARAIRLGRCLVAGLLLSLQNAESIKVRDVEERKGKPGKSHREDGEPAHRMVIVGHALKIDCRPAVSSYIATGKGSKGSKGGKPGLPAVQWMVRGHYRQQVCGVGRLGRRKTWIKPFWKGKADAPILTHARRIDSGEEPLP